MKLEQRIERLKVLISQDISILNSMQSRVSPRNYDRLQPKITRTINRIKSNENKRVLLVMKQLKK